MKALISIAILAAVIVGCATLDKNADPFVVRVEQAQTSAKAGFDFVLRVDHADRGFWREKAPAFHDFCEYLRAPTPYQQTNVPRCIAMQLTVDDAKLVYKSAKSAANSNAVWAAFIALDGLAAQANAWQTIVTNNPAN